MTKYILTIAAMFALLLFGGGAKEANAQGFHFVGGGVHIDVGNPHGGYGHYGYYPQTSYWGGGKVVYGGWGGHLHWHDTTHLDYHPGGYVRHRNHYHYVPGHYDVHEDGHWDHHGF
jgi:hypothetical protein